MDPKKQKERKAKEASKKNIYIINENYLKENL